VKRNDRGSAGKHTRKCRSPPTTFPYTVHSNIIEDISV